MKIVADDKIPFLRGVFEKAQCEVVYLPGKSILAADVADADAVITRTRTRCCRSLLAGSRVKIAATATIGLDHFNTVELDEMGISWCNAPGCNSSSVAQYITAVITRFGNYSGKTLGVVGAGNVGSKVVRCAGALGMKVLVNDPPRAEREGSENFATLEEIKAEADFITMHVPLEKDGRYPTFHLCDDGFFSSLGRKAVFINSSRGEVVDTEALKRALESGRISRAAIDVWENEPEIDTSLLERADIATPHIAGYSIDGKANGTTAVVRAVAEKLGIDELKNWSCQEIIPAPPGGCDIVIPAGVSGLDAVRYAVQSSYDVMRDTAALKECAGKFEELRGSYYIRREFPAFTVKNCDAAAAQILKTLGFVTI
ncbi:MAG: 4-phosphoerythronate dehydrogenase [Lentisphaeria bacterium]|nr:4-phosphoerythronate dehydrogenase [Lentisphaeria bacterium]